MGIDAVHVCTPNASHFEISEAALLAGKHVICEKPLATSVEQAEKLVALAEKKGLRNATNHNLRYYPMVQQMRQMREDGELGEILNVQGSYLQDWLLYETDWNWRVEAKEGGASRVMADIGSHWCDMAEHVSGLRMTALCADLQTFHNTRRRPQAAAETFSGQSASDTDAVPVDTEDFGSVLLRFGERARGSFTASQMAAGRKNRLSVEMHGTKGSAAWDQERPDELWVGRRDGSSQVLLKDPANLRPGAREFADYPGGHSEGYDDTFKQIFRRFYRSIENPNGKPEYPDFSDGLRQLRILEAELSSSSGHTWVEVR
jgi:predicted dehydrogenase